MVTGPFLFLPLLFVPSDDPKVRKPIYRISMYTCLFMLLLGTTRYEEKGIRVYVNAPKHLYASQHSQPVPRVRGIEDGVEVSRWRRLPFLSNISIRIETVSIR